MPTTYMTIAQAITLLYRQHWRVTLEGSYHKDTPFQVSFFHDIAGDIFAEGTTVVEAWERAAALASKHATDKGLVFFLPLVYELHSPDAP